MNGQHNQIPTVKPILYGSVAALVTFAVAFGDAGIASGVKKVRLKASATEPVLVEFFAEVTTAFNAATTNVLTVGSDAASANQFMAAGDITEGTAGFYPATATPLKYRIVADTDVYVKYTQTGQVAQVETSSVVEDAPGTLTAGNATLTFTSALTGVLSIVVALATNDSQNTVATKFRAALNANATFAAYFIASGATNAVIMTALTAAANDSTLNLAYADTTSAGLTDSATSTNTTAGVAYATAGAALIYMRTTSLAPSPNNVLGALA